MSDEILKPTSNLLNILRDRDFLHPGFQQLLPPNRSGLIPLGHLEKGHVGWKEKETRRFVAALIGEFARGGLAAVPEARRRDAPESPRGTHPRRSAILGA